MNKKKKINNAEKNLTFTKKVVIAILCVAEVEVFASYVLAFMGKSDIAEALSIQIVITIIGTVIGYFVKSLIENIFKNNKIIGSPNVDTTKVTVEAKEGDFNELQSSEEDNIAENGRKG